MSFLSRVLFLLTLVASLASCKKDEDEDPAPPMPDPSAAYSLSDFSQLDSGNYWVYERMRYDSNGVYIGGPYLDSFFVAGDTVISGLTYMAMRRSAAGATYSNAWREWRDSADCIVSSSHSIDFRYGVFDQVAWTDTIPFALYVDHTVSSVPVDLSVPAGNFTSYKVSTYVGMINPGLLPVPPARFPYYYWSPGVGKVKQMEPFVSSGIMDVSELLRYHVQ